MRGETCARAAWVAGYSAAAAVIAHAGPAGLADPAWVAVALLGAVVALAALLAGGAAAVRLRSRVARVARADIAAASGPIGAADTPLPALFGLFLVCQTAAHAGLLLLGTHGSTTGAMALHVGLAMLGALVLWLGQQWFGRQVTILAELIARLAASLRAAQRAWPARSDDHARDRRGDSLGARGPPAAVPAR
jgi:hypothetical protein